MSFLFIDRITELVPDTRARGVVTIPPEGEAFPACLAVEAVGQLAGWIAIHRTGFRSRPVAARAGFVEIFREAPPGSRVDLGVEIASAKSVAFSYRGWARVGAETLVELRDSVGAMLPMEEFDAPESARAQLEQLLGPGLPPRAFPRRAAYEPRIELRSFTPTRLEATLHVPGSGELYADHFPRRPVYPATLLLDAQLRLAKRLAAGDAAIPAAATPGVVRHVKVRSFTAPGGSLDVLAELRPRESHDAPLAVAVTASAEGRAVSSATVVLP